MRWYVPLMLLAGACGPEGVDPLKSLAIEAVAGEPALYRPGGPLDLEVTASVDQLRTDTRALVEVLQPQLDDAQRTQTISLIRQNSDGDVRGRLRVMNAKGGMLRVRVTAANAAIEEEISMVAPALTAVTTGERAVGLEWESTVCLSSPVSAGQVQVTLVGARTKSGMESFEVALTLDACGTATGRSYTVVTVRSATGAFTLRAALEGTDATASLVDDANEPSRAASIALSPSVAQLPAAFDVVRIDALVLDADGVGLPGVAVRFAVLPDAPLRAAEVRTDDQGIAVTDFVVPENALAVVVEAVAADVRETVTLTR